MAGYSQGAQVISTTLPQLPADKIAYAATLGDPKLYLPEGVSQNGATPPACLGADLSDYRANVPDCKVSSGILDGIVPYRPETFKNKVGTWCNYADFMCGSKFDLNNLLYGHTSYASNGSHTEIAQHIAAAVAPSDASPAEEAKSEACDLVLIFDQTNLTFETATVYESLAAEVKSRYPEDTQIFAYHYNNAQSTTAILQEAFEHTDWRSNSRREIVLISDNPYVEEVFSPTISQSSIIQLAGKSRTSISVVTSAAHQSSYVQLTAATGGNLEAAEFSSNIKYNNLSLSLALKNTILSSASQLSLVIVNDAILGFTDQTDLTITDLRDGDKVTIVPISASGRRLEPQVYYYRESAGLGAVSGSGLGALPIAVKAPNSGQN